MKINLSDRLSFKQARLGVMAAFFLGILLGLAQVTVDYYAENAAIDQEIAAQINVSLGPASRIAYNIDAELARELVNGLLQAPPIVKAEIIDNNGTPLASVSRPMLSSPYRFISDTLFERRRSYAKALHVDFVPDELLGHLVIELDTFHHGANFLRRAMLTMLSAFILSLALSLILMVLFYTMLTKPLVHLINNLLDIRQHTDHERLPCPPGHQRDEIGALVEVINRQLQSIDVNLRQKLRAEERLKQYLEELETIVEARTNELQQANIQLRKSNQELKDSREEALTMAEARSAFLANMSHEIRTPINGLLGMLGLALDNEMDEEQRQKLTVAYDSGKVLMALLNDILDLSKFEAGKLQLEQIPFDLGELVEDTLSLMSQHTHKEAVELACQVDPQLPAQLEGDPTRVRQVISNLLSNALKFTARGHVLVSLEWQPKHQPARVCIRVEDTGIGIAPEALESIFSPFTQADRNISRRFGGTGLGLALCRSLTDAMGGTLRVESRPQQGSVFSVELPLHAIQEASKPKIELSGKILVFNQQQRLQGRILQQLLQHWQLDAEIADYPNPEHIPQPLPNASYWIIDSPALAESLAQLDSDTPRLLLCPYRQQLDNSKAATLHLHQQLPSPISRARLLRALRQLRQPRPAVSTSTQASTTEPSSARLLLVEDNAVNQMVAKGMLTRMGFEVIAVEHGQAALEWLQQEHCDLVLMDCNMPVMDGYEASRRIRQLPALKDLPIIALTANALQDDRQRCENAGMNDYLAKPFKREDLQKLLHKWLPDEPTTSS
ncbi:hybrid sensor histidine kinase/response regulator [Halopseudomonas salegens]|nr:ATP-binding protein [Halopseudomonas salegens]